jgi:hypothetical protein
MIHTILQSEVAAWTFGIGFFTLAGYQFMLHKNVARQKLEIPILERGYQNNTMSNTSFSSLTTEILRRKGYRVRLDGLKGAKEHNGKFGTVKNLASVMDRKYYIKLSFGSEENAVRLSNLTVCCENKSPLHVLILCHINTDRRFVTFQRTIRSVIH